MAHVMVYKAGDPCPAPGCTGKVKVLRNEVRIVLPDPNDYLGGDLWGCGESYHEFVQGYSTELVPVPGLQELLWVAKELLAWSQAEYPSKSLKQIEAQARLALAKAGVVEKEAIQ